MTFLNSTLEYAQVSTMTILIGPQENIRASTYNANPTVSGLQEYGQMSTVTILTSIASQLPGVRSCGGEYIAILTELGTRSLFPGSLSALHSIFTHGSLLLYGSFCGFSGSLIAQSLSKRPVVCF